MIRRTLDYDLVLAVVNEVYDEISEDGVENWIPDILNEHWVKINNWGLYRLHSVNSVTLQIHALILPEHRDHAKESGQLILQYCLDNLPFEKLIAEIPEKYQNVYHFTKSMGFVDEGINRLSYMKNGKLWNTYRLGMTKQEVTSSLQQLAA